MLRGKKTTRTQKYFSDIVWNNPGPCFVFGKGFYAGLNWIRDPTKNIVLASKWEFLFYLQQTDQQQVNRAERPTIAATAKTKQ